MISYLCQIAGYIARDFSSDVLPSFVETMATDDKFSSKLRHYQSIGMDDDVLEAAAGAYERLKLYQTSMKVERGGKSEYKRMQS